MICCLSKRVSVTEADAPDGVVGVASKLSGSFLELSAHATAVTWVPTKGVTSLIVSAKSNVTVTIDASSLSKENSVQLSIIGRVLVTVEVSSLVELKEVLITSTVGVSILSEIKQNVVIVSSSNILLSQSEISVCVTSGDVGELRNSCPPKVLASNEIFSDPGVLPDGVKDRVCVAATRYPVGFVSTSNFLQPTGMVLHAELTEGCCIPAFSIYDRGSVFSGAYFQSSSESIKALRSNKPAVLGGAVTVDRFLEGCLLYSFKNTRSFMDLAMGLPNSRTLKGLAEKVHTNKAQEVPYNQERARFDEEILEILSRLDSGEYIMDIINNLKETE